ncbi:TonB-dependent receptor domain-containing protein [Pseudoduganella sp. S-14]|jgi:hypothetical protein|uniref:TonB-dependent receptor n=1 Tax=Pseudoduganella sp. S-14 TaxID=3404065 RepID=UPI003CF05A47
MMNHKRLRLTQIALSLSLVFAAPAFAQNTTSAIGGRISGSDGKPTAGATVHVLHVESGSVSTVTTDAEGRYVARGLRAGGPYTITITKNGVSEKRDNVFVEVAETAAVDATIGQAMQTVTIAGSSAARSEKFSKTNMGSGSSISAAELAIQGSIQRNLQDYARMDPRVSQTDKERGELSIAGQNSRYNSMTIDGVAVNDTFGLEANGSPMSKQPISIEAIQSVQVNVANYDVTQKGYTGGNINAVTKSGTNKVHGSLYYVFQNDKMIGDRFNPSTGLYTNPVKQKNTTKGATVGAPLIKDKLFIFANYEKKESPSVSTPPSGPIGSSLNNVGITSGQVQTALDTAKQVYGIDGGAIGSGGGVLLDVTDKLVKFDWNINDDHRAMVRWSKTEESNPVFPGSSNSNMSLSSYWYTQVKSLETKVAQLTSDWTSNFSTELKFSDRDYNSVPTVASQLPSITLNYGGPLPAGAGSGVSTNERGLFMGTEASRQRNVLSTRTKDVYAGANWTLGDHELKFGGDLNSNKVTNAFLQNVNGTYNFGCIKGIAYQSLGGKVLACDPKVETNAEFEAAMLENFRNGRPTLYRVQIAQPGHTLDDAIAAFTAKDYGLFVQDTWSINKDLTITAGVRIDQTTINERPTANAALAAAPGPIVAGRATGGFGLDNTTTFDGQKLWQPRFGFNYKLPGVSDRPTQVRGGFGLFQGSAMGVWMGNPFQNNGVATRTLSCTSSSSPACPTGIFSADPTKQVTTLPGAVPAQAVDLLSPGLKQPSVWKANLAFDTELPWYGLILTAEVLDIRAKTAAYYRDENLGAPTRIGADGREMYWTAQGFNTNCFVASTGATTTSGAGCAGLRNRAGSNAGFTTVYNAVNTKQGYSKLATLSLSRPLTGGFGWSMSYTYTDAKEVSPLTASTSGTNWMARANFNPNEEVLANSSYLVKDRVNAMVNFRKAFFGNYRTSVGLFYEGRTGKPFSWTFNNDMNGDSVIGNDLMYIPSRPYSGEVIFKGDTATNHANEDKFWDIVNSSRALRNAKGHTTQRNDSFAPWTNSFDLRLSQELPSFFAGHKASFTFDIFNVGNLLNKKWGRVYDVSYQGSSTAFLGGANARSFVDYAGVDANGKYIYSVRDLENYSLKTDRNISQWALQATLKYEF